MLNQLSDVRSWPWPCSVLEANKFYLGLGLVTHGLGLGIMTTGLGLGLMTSGIGLIVHGLAIFWQDCD